MGTYTTSDIVPFIAHNIWEGESGDDDKVCLLWSSECYDEEYEDEPLEGVVFGTSGDETTIDYKGWSWGGLVDVGKHARLHGEQWSKGEYTVVTLNESQYSMVGNLEAAITADDEESIHEFCKDMDLHARFGVEGPDAAQQTG